MCRYSQAVHPAVHPAHHAGATARGEGDGERRPDERHSENDMRVQPGGGRHRRRHDPEPGRNTALTHTFLGLVL